MKRPDAGRFGLDEAPELIFDIRSADGAEAVRLRLEQAEVLWEVTQWQARNRSADGLGNAA
ncbi:hypothetical protein ACWEHA_06255 [Amycolatopsis nivea]